MSQKSANKIIIFDLDGTIIDSERLAANVMVQVFQEMGVPLRAEEADLVVGRTWDSALDFLKQRHSFDLDGAHLRDRVMESYRVQRSKAISAVPGVVNSIRSLSSRLPLAVVSGSDREDIEWALQTLAIGSCFQFYLGSEDYSSSKPSPEGYLLAAERLGVSPSEILVFEDSEAGIQAARRAGMAVIAVQCTNYFGMDQSQADGQISDFSKVNLD